MPETTVTEVHPAPATEPSTVVASFGDILRAEFEEKKEPSKAPPDSGQSREVLPPDQKSASPQEPQHLEQQQPQSQTPAQASPYGLLKPEFLNSLQEYYSQQAEKSTAKEPEPKNKYEQILKQYNISGNYRDEEELIARLAAGYRSEEKEKQYLTAALQQLTASQKQPSPPVPPKDDLGELSWTTSYNPAWDSLLTEDPSTGQVVYRPEVSEADKRDYERWSKQREKTWQKWMNNPQTMAKEISKFIDTEGVKKTAEEAARNQVAQTLQFNQQRNFLENYITKNAEVFIENRGGQSAPSPWANRVHQLLLPREQGGWALPINEAIAQFEREYALAHYMSQGARSQQPLPERLPTGVPNLTLEQAAATSMANKVVSPKETNTQGKASLGEILRDQMARAGIL